VYQQIMEKVIQASQNDFEESGVDHSTLEEMKQVRGNAAIILAVAHFLPQSQRCASPPPRSLLFFSPVDLVGVCSHHFSLAATMGR
jgi:hypothetical protein